jgi:hypothetical protein
MVDSHSFMISQEVRAKLEVLCFDKKLQLDEGQLLLDYKTTNDELVDLDRSNLFSVERINNVTYEGIYCFSTWSMGDEALKIAKLMRLKGVSYREAVAFFVPANHVVPAHRDDTAGRERQHLTFALQDTGAVFKVNGNEFRGMFTSVFSPVTQEHSLVNGNRDLFVMQMPLL